MKEYVCIFCGYIFSEEKGVGAERMAPNFNALRAGGCGWHKQENETPHIPVAPGTAWENVPEGFVCPSCGAAKEMFEPFSAPAASRED